MFFTQLHISLNQCPPESFTPNAPFESLFHTPPNYTTLKTFGCLSYPWLRPYAQHKLDQRSKPCVFLRYSITQSAYKCLDLSTNKIYLFYHVWFVEDVFLFSKELGKIELNALIRYTRSYKMKYLKAPRRWLNLWIRSAMVPKVLGVKASDIGNAGGNGVLCFTNMDSIIRRPKE